MRTLWPLKTIIPPLLLSLFLIIAFYDVVLLGRTFKVTTANSQALSYGVYGQTHNKPAFIPVHGTDTPVLEEPLFAFIKFHLQQGIFPLWNPHQACGYPLIAMLEAGLFFPLHLILYLLPNTYAWDLLVLSRLFLAGIFTYLFMRKIGLCSISAIIAATIFMLSGPLLLLQWWTANVDILAPLLLIAVEHFVCQPSPRRMAMLSIIVSLTIFAGHPEHILFVNTYGTVYFLFRLIIHTNANRLRCCGYFFLAYLLGATISAVALFPFIQNLLTEFWNGHPPNTGLLMEEQRSRAITLILPHFFQKAPVTYQWEFAGWWGGYLGIIPVSLAFLGLFHRRRSLNIFFGCLTFLLLGKAYGLPIINWIGYLPLFNICRFAIHTPPLVALSIAILAGMGFHALSEDRPLFKKSAFFSLLLVLVISSYLYIYRKTDHIDLALRASGYAWGLLIIFSALIFLHDKHRLTKQVTGFLIITLLFLELVSYIHRERPNRFDSFPRVPYIDFLKSSSEKVRSYGIFWDFYPNTATGYQLDDLGYFFGLIPKRFVDFVNNILIKDHFKNNLQPPALRAFPIQHKESYLDLLNIQYIIAPTQERLMRLPLPPQTKLMPYADNPAYHDEVFIFDRKTAYPRAFIVHRAIFQTDPKQTLRMLQEIGPQLRHVALINASPIPQMIEDLRKAPVSDASSADIIEYTPNKVVITVNMKNSGILVLSDAYHPDWKVFVDGKVKTLFQTDYLIRGVFLEAGPHKVVFVFHPPFFYIGLIVTLLSIAVTAALLTVKGHKNGQAPYDDARPQSKSLPTKRG